MMVGVANRCLRNRRGPTPADTTDQCLAGLPVNVGRVQLGQLGNWVAGLAALMRAYRPAMRPIFPQRSARRRGLFGAPAGLR